MKFPLSFSTLARTLAGCALLAFTQLSAAQQIDPDLVPIKKLAEAEAATGDAGARAMLLTIQNAASEAETKAGYEWLARAAERGHPEAQFQVALTIEHTQPEQIAQAVRWYVAAANQGFALAQSNLASLYIRGVGVAQSDTRAAEWSLKAAEQGNAMSQARLGTLYASGRGVPKDGAKAAMWLEKAALQGLANAQAHLGAIYILGLGVPKNEEKGMFWTRKAAEMGQTEAVQLLAALNTAKPGSAKAEPPSFSKSRMGADAGDPVSQYTVGLMYQRGEAGAPKDAIEAAKWMARAAEKGYSPAQAQLGYYYANAIGVTKDEEEAVRWFRLAADGGNAQAQSSLAGYYSRGSGGLKRDYAEAAKLYKKSADQNHAAGMAGYAWHLETGAGVAQDLNAALIQYRKAAALGNDYARQQLARLGG